MTDEEKRLLEKIGTGIRHCLPITPEETWLSCETCPYCAQCDGSDYEVSAVRLPVEMIEDIRTLTGNYYKR